MQNKYLPKKEYVRDNSCEQKETATNIKYLTCFPLHRHLENQKMTAKKEYLDGNRCETINMAAKCKIFLII